MRSIYANFKMNSFFGRDVLNKKDNIQKKSRMKQVKIDGALPASTTADKNPLRKRIFSYKED